MTQQAKNNLVNISINRVASVDKAANRRTFAVLKRAQEPPVTTQLTTTPPIDPTHSSSEGDPVTKTAAETKPDLSGLNAEQKAYVEKLEKSAATPQVVTVSEGEDYEAEIRKMDASEAVKEQLIKSERRAREGERIAKEERDARRRTDHIAKAAKDYGVLNKSAEGLGELMMKLEDQCDKGTYTQVTGVLKSASAIAKSGEIFKELGDGGETETGSAYSELQKAASELRKNDTTLTKQQAMVEATKQNPELAKRYKDEQGK